MQKLPLRLCILVTLFTAGPVLFAQGPTGEPIPQKNVEVPIDTRLTLDAAAPIQKFTWMRQLTRGLPADLQRPGTVSGDPIAVNDYRAVEELAEVIPIEIPAVLELLHQAHRIESIARLPELQYQKAADEWLVERPGGEYAKIVDIARLVPLITCSDFLGKDFGQRKAGDFGRCERQ
jgi:hypothetical protein